jgi:NitT/TauT family transport system substrate-binding protein
MFRANFNPSEFIMSASLTRRAFAATALSALAAPLTRSSSTRSRSAPTGSPRPSTAASIRQAADGTYRKYGLDVTIVPGGPQVNNRMLLLAGRIDFFMSANCLQSFDAVAQNIPVIAVSAIFQKDPQVLLAHPGAAETFEDLKKLTILVSSEGLQTYYKWMQAEFGFSESQDQALHVQPAAVPGRHATARCRAT